MLFLCVSCYYAWTFCIVSGCTCRLIIKQCNLYCLRCLCIYVTGTGTGIYIKMTFLLVLHRKNKTFDGLLQNLKTQPSSKSLNKMEYHFKNFSDFTYPFIFFEGLLQIFFCDTSSKSLLQLEYQFKNFWYFFFRFYFLVTPCQVLLYSRTLAVT